MSAQKHVHRYERAFLGKKGTYEVFRCNLPDCTHYLSKKLVKGKLTICNRCGNEMIMDSRAMQLEKPHCVDCIQIKKKDTHDKLLEFVLSNDIAISNKGAS